MINVKDIIQSVRFKQKDNNEVKFSDYDIIQSLNEAVRYINRTFALKNSDFLEKEVEYRLDEINDQIFTLLTDIDACTRIAQINNDPCLPILAAAEYHIL